MRNVSLRLAPASGPHEGTAPGPLDETPGSLAQGAAGTNVAAPFAVEPPGEVPRAAADVENQGCLAKWRQQPGDQRALAATRRPCAVEYHALYEGAARSKSCQVTPPLEPDMHSKR